MSLTKASYSMISGAVVNVLDFGADPTGVADSTSAIQAAVNSITNGTVYFPNGTFKITSTINIDADTQYSLNLLGNGLASKILYDGTTSTIPMVYYQGGSNSAFPTIEGLQFFNNYHTGDTTLNGIVGLRIGKKDAAALNGDNGTCNVTIRKCQFQYFQIPIEIYSESDQITIEDNYLFVFTEYGILCTVVGPLSVSGNANSAVRVWNNHIIGPQQDSIAVRFSGSAVSARGNVIQSAQRFNGIRLVGCHGFVVTDNYFEGGAGTTSNYVVLCEGSYAGYIGEMEMGGFAAANLISIDANSHDINIGNNFHASSAGTPTSFIDINATATGINILGKQYSNGALTNDIVGLPSFKIDGDGNTTSSASVTSPLITTEKSFINIAGASSTTLFTAVANGCYLVNVSQEQEDYAATAIVTVIGNTATVNVNSVYSTNANLSITATGLAIKANNGVGSTRTVYYGFIRIA
jgi:hypothetical protein